MSIGGVQLTSFVKYRKSFYDKPFITEKNIIFSLMYVLCARVSDVISKSVRDKLIRGHLVCGCAKSGRLRPLVYCCTTRSTEECHCTPRGTFVGEPLGRNGQILNFQYSKKIQLSQIVEWCAVNGFVVFVEYIFQRTSVSVGINADAPVTAVSNETKNLQSFGGVTKLRYKTLRYKISKIIFQSKHNNYHRIINSIAIVANLLQFESRMFPKLIVSMLRFIDGS